MIGDDVAAAAIAGFANAEGDVEPERLDAAIEFAGELDPAAAIAPHQICRVHPGDRPAKFEALVNQIARCGENAGVDGLVGLIIRKELANGVR